MTDQPGVGVWAVTESHMDPSCLVREVRLQISPQVADIRSVQGKEGSANSKDNAMKTLCLILKDHNSPYLFQRLGAAGTPVTGFQNARLYVASQRYHGILDTALCKLTQEGMHTLLKSLFYSLVTLVH